MVNFKPGEYNYGKNVNSVSDTGDLEKKVIGSVRHLLGETRIFSKSPLSVTE